MLDKKFINWRMAVRESSDLTSTQKLICFVLNTYMNDDQDCAWPAASTLAGQCGLARETVLKNLSKLADMGWLIKLPQFDSSGRQKSNKYQIDMPDSVAFNAGGGDTRSPSGVTQDHWGRVTQDHPNSKDTNSTKGIDNARSGSPSSPVGSEESPSLTRSSSDDRFADWWAQYPKKVGKKNCRTIWKRRKLDTIADTLISDVMRRQANDKKWIEGYIPNPQTYLNGDRWEDEITERKSKTQSQYERLAKELNGGYEDKTAESPVISLLSNRN